MAGLGYNTGRTMALGSPPRIDWRDNTGVAAETPSTAAKRRDTASSGSGTQISLAGAWTLGVNARNRLLGRTGKGALATKPRIRMGPVPKLSQGSGQTGPHSYGQASTYSPGGYAGSDQTPSPGMEMMPYRRDSFDASPVGIPLKGVAATSGREFIPTYKSHDWAWVPRFLKHGRSPGPWQETAFGPGFRYLQPVQTPIRYNLGNTVHLARPLSPQAYFLGYQTTSDVYASMGAGGPGVRPLGY
jgi:hypothetical protein